MPEVPPLLPSLIEGGLKEAEDGESILGGIACPRSEPGSISRDGGRFQLRCLYKHVIKTAAEKQPGCSARGREEEKRRKPKKPLALSAPAAMIHMTLRTWDCLDETEQLSRAQPVRSGSERESQAGLSLPEPRLSTRGEEKRQVNAQERRLSPCRELRRHPSVRADVHWKTPSAQPQYCFKAETSWQ